jgi:hypothetical protein
MKLAAASLSSLLAVATPAAALELEFADHHPAGVDLGSVAVHVDKGVEPGVDIAFDTTPAGLTVRPARPDEHSDAQHWVYRFEWKAENGALFYAVPDPAHVAELTARNAADTATETGSAYEQEAARELFAEGALGPHCLKDAQPTDGPFRLFVSIDRDGKATETFAVPVGHVATCLADQARGHAFASPKPTTAEPAFVAIVSVHVKP